MPRFWFWLDRWLPRRLTTRLILALVVIVVAAGLITAVAVHLLLARALRAELIRSGRSLTLALGENLANALAEGDLATVQELLSAIVQENGDVVYAFAVAPHMPLVHTFPNGFPRDLLRLIPASGDLPGDGVLLQTELGRVRDFAYRPLDGIPAEVHIGVSQARIEALQGQVARFIIGLTLIGCLIAAGVAYGFGQVAVYPLVELTRRAQRLGQGYLDERVHLPPGGEIGDLAQAFNQMADEIQRVIRQLRESEAGYRDLLKAASTVGEGIALIGEEGEEEGKLVFVNEAFARLLGFEPGDLIGLNVASVLPPDALEDAHRLWAAIRKDRVAQPVELRVIDRDGRPHVLETTGARISYQGRWMLAWFVRDITERKAREEELRRRNRELMALNAIASAVSEPMPSSRLLERALRQALNALDLQVGWIFIMENSGLPRLAASHGLIPGEAQEVEKLFNFPECRCGQVLIDGQPVIVGSVESRCAVRRIRSALELPLTCHAAVPIPVQGRIQGVLAVASESPRVFDQAEMTLLMTIAQQIGIALENARLWEELRRKEQIRGELLARLMRAQEEERLRIARELHDGIGQSMSALVFGLNAISVALTQAPEEVPRLLDRLKVSTSDAIKELQDIIYDLRPTLLDDLGLVQALKWYARERLESRGIRVVFEIPDALPRFSPEIETALFRIGQEAITNICKHAEATEVRIRLWVEGGWAGMEIADNGVGFRWSDMQAEKGLRRGWGLLGMQERAALLGGRLTIESAPGQGTRLCVHLPWGVEGWESES
ncbi:Signal transduction histidine-protein kinase/phosphatase DegS [Candidatus Thermoflexus japonica]|uniref:histidine kinase n=1 Tax=Candidatus Thermoflexus japonica TaxID=2035417 RepID=A0A2H5Y3V6_9CHLR|nr:Signal transduction histidine-protein kinase/phosphatase DegS [Candidatus Thermoflexus japonica]